eukprot:TRINITY_DN5873_c0_g1_i2.p1 TRINITY_DN5873_c0_g1~~TRINITY_DN5873_c0_g1_i2.p1  ORF type:complete len:623 (-),score=96.55 TRINITY_DN5873_c0_g1_i2:72-1940(-)
MCNYERFSAPWKSGKYYFFYRNDGLQNQAVIYVTESIEPNAPIRPLIDPNQFDKEGNNSLQGVSSSSDGKYLAYGISAGFDWKEWKIVDVETGKTLPDVIKWSKNSTPAWTNDGKGFFYSRYAPPKTETEYYQGINQDQKVYYHRLGTPQSSDVLVYHSPLEPHLVYSTNVSEDGRFLIIAAFKGTTPNNAVFIKDLTEPYGFPIGLISDYESKYSFIGNNGVTLYFVTDFEAPNNRVVSINWTDTSEPRKITEVLPQTDNPLASVSIVNNMLIATYIKDACSLIKVYGINGVFIFDVDLPSIGTAAGFSGKATDTSTFYVFHSFVMAPSILRLDLVSRQSVEFRTAKTQINPEEYITTLEFSTSRDGTKVPLFVVQKKGAELNGKSPLLLSGYGGFGISNTPTFSISIGMWLKMMDGIFVQAVIRGGGEYGNDWHKGGSGKNKQNSFDDFISVAEFLIQKGYCSNETLVIQGTSNAGLLVGAAVVQRPDLFKLAFLSGGVLDMLRYPNYTYGRFWIDEYGDPSKEDEFPIVYKYSPYHNIQKTSYPNIMILTSDSDDRVVPLHCFKYGASLQHNNTGKSVVLLRIEANLGHGLGKPTSKFIQEITDKWSFAAYCLNRVPNL